MTVIVKISIWVVPCILLAVGTTCSSSVWHGEIDPPVIVVVDGVPAGGSSSPVADDVGTATVVSPSGTMVSSFGGANADGAVAVVEVVVVDSPEVAPIVLGDFTPQPTANTRNITAGSVPTSVRTGPEDRHHARVDFARGGR